MGMKQEGSHSLASAVVSTLHLQYIINKNVYSYNIRTMSRLLHNVTEYEHELSMAFIAATYI